MECSVKKEGAFSVIALEGEVDLHVSPKARKEILHQLKQHNNVLVDLSGVTYIDSSGVASLVEGYQVAKSSQLEFGLVRVSDAAMQVLHLARLDQVFPIHASVSERIAKSD
jgi:anti-sigma B factor antagonist